MSREHESPDNELNAIESALAGLVPVRTRLDRDYVMFQAGQAALRTSQAGRRIWMALAASLGIIAVGEGVLLAHRPSPGVVEKIVVVREPAQAPVDAPTSSGMDTSAPRLASSYPSSGPLGMGQTPSNRLAWQVLRYGLDGLPASPPAASADSDPWPTTSRQWLEQELRKDLDSGDPS